MVIALAMALTAVAAAHEADRRTRARIQHNEATVIATLKNLCSAEAQLQASGRVPGATPETGQFGYFGELAGTAPLPDGAMLDPPVLGRPFGQTCDAAGNGQGAVVRHGYVLQLWLPAAEGSWSAGDLAGGRRRGSVDRDAATRLWLCYAWPVEAGQTGQRAFVVTQDGDVLSARNADGRYSGTRAPIAGRTGLREPTEEERSPERRLFVAANVPDRLGTPWVVIG